MSHTYAFVTVPATFEARRSKPPTYQDVILEHARNGWRFVQLVVEVPAAVPHEYVLIFERPDADEPPTPR